MPVFKVKVDQFYIDGSYLSDALTSAVTRDVLAQIKQLIQDKIDNMLVVEVESAVNNALEPMINEILAQFVAEGMIMPKSGGYGQKTVTEPIPINDHLRSVFMQNTGWNAEAEIKKFAKKFGEEMKLQYNAAFANQIVANMKEQGLLKDEVTQILLGGKK